MAQDRTSKLQKIQPNSLIDWNIKSPRVSPVSHTTGSRTQRSSSELLILWLCFSLLVSLPRSCSSSSVPKHVPTTFRACIYSASSCKMGASRLKPFSLSPKMEPCYRPWKLTECYLAEHSRVLVPKALYRRQDGVFQRYTSLALPGRAQ